MEVCCDLEVDINGEEIFMVDKEVLSSFSVKIRNMFSKLKGSKGNLKVIFHDFPGGVEGFELMAKFCYNKGRTQITPSNVVLLNCAAHFMEMDKNISGISNLTDLVDKFLEGISFWTWSDLLVALQQCQDLLPAKNVSSVLQKVFDCLVGKLVSPSVASPYTCSSGNFSLSTVSTRDVTRTTWWFEDLLFLDIYLIDKVVMTMVSQINFDHATICKFLFYYRKSRFLGASAAEKRKITEEIINLLCLLDRSSISWKGLFDIFQVASSLKVSRHCKKKLESMIGSQLDQATLDYLLVRSPCGKDYKYDVSLVIRLVKAFLLEDSSVLSLIRLKKVASLIDSYLVEVGPDPHLKPSKFAALVLGLPDSARESHEQIYQAIDMYLEVHAGLREEEKMRVCLAVNYDKLSTEALKHLAQNSKFPPKMAVQAFINLMTFNDSPSAKKTSGGKVNAEQILLYANKLNLSTRTEKIEARIQGMHWKVTELEKFCRTMQTQMGYITKTGLFLPKLCS